jgi:glycosyltransferase involved in cell wall biosynthesis
MPSVLFLTHTPPLPLVSGERIRNFNLLRELARRDWEVSLFAVDAVGGMSDADRSALEEICVEVVVEPLRTTRRERLARMAGSVLRSRSFHERFFYDEDAHRTLLSLLARNAYDLVVVEGLYMDPYVPRDVRRRALLDAHNVELHRVEAMARSVGLTPRGIAARMQRRPLRAYEREVVSSVAAVTCVSEIEAAHFRTLTAHEVHVVPNGVDCDALRPRESLPSAAGALFVGSMDYSANVDAVGYLAREILPHVRRRDAVVTVIGSNPRAEVFAQAEQSPVPVEVLGFVADTSPYFAARRAFVVPLRFGGGTRLKILEAMARGIPVVSTSVGCEGLDVEPGRDLLVADDPADFARALELLFEDDALCERLARTARTTVERLYDWSHAGDLFDAVARGLVEGAGYHRPLSGGVGKTTKGGSCG